MLGGQACQDDNSNFEVVKSVGDLAAYEKGQEDISEVACLEAKVDVYAPPYDHYPPRSLMSMETYEVGARKFPNIALDWWTHYRGN